MVYSEAWPSLNPCDPQMIKELLSAYANPDLPYMVTADIGCGRGDTLACLSEQTKYKLYGTDLDTALLDRARVICPDATFMEGSADNLPFSDGLLDIAILECVFSLLDEPTKAAKELARVIKDGGVLLLSDLYTQAAEDVYIGTSECLGHVYTRQTLESLIAQGGFRLLAFYDRTSDLRGMMAQMIMSGTSIDCIDEESRRLLRQAKAGYGIWIWGRAGC